MSIKILKKWNLATQEKSWWNSVLIKKKHTKKQTKTPS